MGYMRSLECPRATSTHALLRPRIGRRGMVLGGLALAGLLLGPSRAFALRFETAKLPFLAITEREGVLSWRELESLARRGPASGLNFEPEVRQVQNALVTVEGFMLPYDDSPSQLTFLIAAFQAHCMFCMPGSMLSLMEVSAARPIPAGRDRVALQGRLQLLDGSEGGLLFRLTDAVSLGS
jgi:hypothetical protein